MSLATPTLPGVTSWSPQDLTAHSAHWQDLAARRTSVLERIKSDATSLDFTGAGQKGMMDAVSQHHATATEQADELASAAQTAERYTEQLSQQQKTILGIVTQARNQGFEVSPTWQVTDVQSHTAVEAMVRQPAAQAIAAQLAQHVATFMATHTAAGVDLTTHAGKLAGVQMVDNKFKTGGGDDEPGIYDDPGNSMYPDPLAPPGPLEQQVNGGPPLNSNWVKDTAPTPSPAKCSLGEFAGDAGNTAMHTAMETAGLAALPEEGPGAVAGGAALLYGAHTIASDSEKMIDCMEKGIDW